MKVHWLYFNNRFGYRQIVLLSNGTAVVNDRSAHF